MNTHPVPYEALLEQSTRQPASKLCYVCGKENTYGLQLDFFNTDTKVWTIFTPEEHHQSWPGIVHGGILSTVLDETISRVAFLNDKWVQTGKLALKYRKPAPLYKPLLVEATILRDAGKVMELQGTIQNAETGELLTEASGLFIRIPDSERQRLMESLGDEFSGWEAWFAQMRQSTEIAG